MSRIVTLRIDDQTYSLLKRLAGQENRPLSNFIETAALRHIEAQQHADAFEDDATRADEALQHSLRTGVADYAAGRGRFV